MVTENTIEQLPKGIHLRIQKDGTHVFDCTVSYRDTMSGKWKLKTKTAPSIGKAMKLRAEMVTQLKNGYSQSSKTTVKLYMEEWLDGVVKATVGGKTHELYEYMTRVHIVPTLGNIQLNQLRPAQIQSLYSKKLETLSPRTVQLIHVCFHKALAHAVKSEILTKNPMDCGVIQPKAERHEMNFMDEKKISQFLNEARKTEYYELFYTSLFTGARRGELLSLRWGDVDLDERTISINRTMQFLNNKISFKSPKTSGSRRAIPICRTNVALLNAHRKEQDSKRNFLEPKLDPATDSDLVFCHVDGKPYLPRTISHCWFKIAHRCGLDGVRLHDARHSFASIMGKRVPLKMLSEILGHSSAAFTANQYQHILPGMARDAIDIYEEAIIGKPKESTEPDVKPSAPQRAEVAVSA